MAGCASDPGAGDEPTTAEGLSFHDAWPTARETALAWNPEAAFAVAVIHETRLADPPPEGYGYSEPFVHLWAEVDPVTDGRHQHWAFGFHPADDGQAALVVVVSANGTVQSSEDPSFAPIIGIFPTVSLSAVDAVRDSSLVMAEMLQREDVQECLSLGEQYALRMRLHVVDGVLYWQVMARYATRPIEVGAGTLHTPALGGSVSGMLTCPLRPAEGAYEQIDGPSVSTLRYHHKMGAGHDVLSIRLHLNGAALAAAQGVRVTVTDPAGLAKSYDMTGRSSLWGWMDPIVEGQWTFDLEGAIPPETFVSLAWCASGEYVGPAAVICEWVYRPTNTPPEPLGE